MAEITPTDRRLRVLYAGTPCALARGPLLALLGAGIEVCGVVIPAERGTAPIARLAPPPARSPLPIAGRYVDPGIVEIAWERGVAVFAADKLADPATVAALAELRPDIACASCFPRRIPTALLRLPPLGWLNVHPSLLPAYRGPAPLFWALRNGETTIGVTLHFMDHGFDTGDIAAQATMALPDGIGGAQTDQMCAALGGRLLVEALNHLRQGNLERSPQPAGGSYQGLPAPQDWTISTSWPARRAFNFMRGTDDWKQRYEVLAGDERLILATVLAYDPIERLGVPFIRNGREVAIQCTPGVLRAIEAF
ncbi:MAG TPA: formyltransferase family protein [Roseiflexaceae bacterium]|nr:formyltransferase family protein [Roseiflexaceae bacterium]